VKTRVKEVGIGKTEGTAGMVKIHGGASEDPVPLVRKADAFSSGSLEIIVSLCIRFRQEASGRYEAGDSGWSRMDPGGASREPPRRSSSKKDVTTMKKLMTVLALLALCAVPVMAATTGDAEVTLTIGEFFAISNVAVASVAITGFDEDGTGGSGDGQATFDYLANAGCLVSGAFSAFTGTMEAGNFVPGSNYADVDGTTFAGDSGTWDFDVIDIDVWDTGGATLTLTIVGD